MISDILNGLYVSSGCDWSAKCRTEIAMSILKAHTQSLKLSDEVDLAQVAELTLGYGDADIASLCREAAFVALRRMINQSDNGNQDSLSVQETLKGNESNVIGFWINKCGFESL